MHYRTVGRSDVNVSEIGFGCGAGAGFMVRDEPELQKAAVARALELGITYFDTAPIYGATKSETYLGRALKALDVKPVVGTKIALEIDQLDDIQASVVASVEASLGRLGRDLVEIVYLHNRVGSKRAPKPDMGVGALLTVEDVLGPRGVLAGLESLRKRGLVRAFGCCSYGGETAALDQLVASDRFDLLLTHYNLINQTAFRQAPAGSTLYDYHQIAARATARGMGCTILRVLEAGVLAGQSREVKSTKRDDNESRAAAFDYLRDGDATLGPTAIRFALSTPGVAIVLVGISDISHVDEAVAAADRGPLEAKKMASIEATFAKS